MDKLAFLHGEKAAEKLISRMKELLVQLYGEEFGKANYSYLSQAMQRYLERKSDKKLLFAQDRIASDPYGRLDGKVFAIAYPDNIFTDREPTLRTLEQTLSDFFPDIKGIHILPERPMSHEDVWAQDLFPMLEPAQADGLIKNLRTWSAIDESGAVLESYLGSRAQIENHLLRDWYRNQGSSVKKTEQEFVTSIVHILDAAYDSHFNDGGFSQTTREIVDPRFGTVDDIRRISGNFGVMLDYVVNHLDIDNEVLNAYRNGENDGSSFIIISPAEYEKMKQDGDIAKTFRPRPFPLYTGLRKYPAKKDRANDTQVDEMNALFVSTGIDALDNRLVAFLAIDFKIRNDQGLSAAERRTSADFLQYLLEIDMDKSRLFEDSKIQPKQMIYCGKAAQNMAGLLDELGVDGATAELFQQNDDLIFGEKFFIYTTFSESQVDVNPVSQKGFSLVVDDLFYLLDSGDMAMMRMDAIKYLWKEKGKRNFDMEEGNILIEVIRLIMQMVEPMVIPLDEINSPDTVVYEMEADGGFAYLFGQVNAVPIAFNEGTLAPLICFRKTMEERCPQSLVLFVMLSTHDGRSVQGLGVQHLNGHVSIEQFYHLVAVVEERGGKPKFRTVPVGEIPADCFQKVCNEANINRDAVMTLFVQDAGTAGVLHLKNKGTTKEELLMEIADVCEQEALELAKIPAIDFFLDWVAEGRTVYELCCTSRSAFKPVGPADEANLLALSQVYVLTLGQVVPAIYFNDLLGLENDFETFSRTGKPRDLNRHKNYLPQTDFQGESDGFGALYYKKINAILKARSQDQAFYPGSPDFEFLPLTDTVFLNHPFARGCHSFIVGNIEGKSCDIRLDIADLSGIDDQWLRQYSKLTDRLTQIDYVIQSGTVSVHLEPYGALWLSPQI